MTPREAVEIYLKNGYDLKNLGVLRQTVKYFHIYTEDGFEGGSGIYLPSFYVKKDNGQLIKNLTDDDDYNDDLDKAMDESHDPESLQMSFKDIPQSEYL